MEESQPAPAKEGRPQGQRTAKYKKYIVRWANEPEENHRVPIIIHPLSNTRGIRKVVASHGQVTELSDEHLEIIKNTRFESSVEIGLDHPIYTIPDVQQRFNMLRQQYPGFNPKQNANTGMIIMVKSEPRFTVEPAE